MHTWLKPMQSDATVLVFNVGDVGCLCLIVLYCYHFWWVPMIDVPMIWQTVLYLHLYIKQLSFSALLRPWKHWMHSLLLFELPVKYWHLYHVISFLMWLGTDRTLFREVLVEKVNLKHLKFPLKQFQQKHNLNEGRFNCRAVVCCMILHWFLLYWLYSCVS